METKTEKFLKKFILKPLPFVLIAALILYYTYGFGTTAEATVETINSSNASWPVPADVYYIQVEAWGGGGAGAGESDTTTGGMGGGGGGAYAQNFLKVVPGSTHAIVIGAGGSPVNWTTGGDGGNTTFDVSLVVAAGGKGGGDVQASYAGGAGGLASNSTGLIKFSGGSGGNGALSNSGSGAGEAVLEAPTTEAMV